MPAPTWREVAAVLAERLSHASCPDHAETRAVPQDCPFCADRAAYRLWQRKNRAHPLTAPAAVRVVDDTHPVDLTI